MDELTNKIRFQCPACNGRIDSDPDEAGQELECPDCSASLTIPGKPAVSAANVDEGAVPFKVSVPGVTGMQTSVSKSDAGKMATTFLGGMLVALGVIIAMVFGVKPQARV